MKYVFILVAVLLTACAQNGPTHLRERGDAIVIPQTVSGPPAPLASALAGADDLSLRSGEQSTEK
ncbi:hypothetical protein ACINK0_16935 [Deinococcus sp. VB343]|uniref:hypothetical protein n=1 Tax=Deinococcus sp. VB343 TaxID=3385567 RepID=UPI0039C91FB1